MQRLLQQREFLPADAVQARVDEFPWARIKFVPGFVGSLPRPTLVSVDIDRDVVVEESNGTYVIPGTAYLDFKGDTPSEATEATVRLRKTDDGFDVEEIEAFNPFDEVDVVAAA